MRSIRTAAVVLTVIFTWAGTAAAASDMVHPHSLKKRGVHWQPGAKPGKPGPASPAAPLGKSVDVEVLGHHDPGGPNGDVSVHRGFAYLGSWGLYASTGQFCPARGVRVYDLRNPRSPQLVSTFAGGAANPQLAGSWTEKVLVRKVSTRSFKGDLAAVSFQDCRPGGFTGIGLYDVTSPRSPKLLSLRQSGIFGVHELWLEARGNRAYLYEAAIFEEYVGALMGDDPATLNPDLRIVDVTDPRNPAQVGRWGAWKELGADPLAGLGTFPANYVHSIHVDGKVAYVSYWDLGTVLLDVRDPAKPKYLGRTTYGPDAEGNAHSAWTARGGSILIQTDEDFDPAPSPGVETGWGYAHLFDVRNKANPVRLSTFKLPSTHQFPPPGPGDFTVHDPKVRGKTLYLTYYTEGVVLVDISNPRNPTKIGQFVPPAKAPDPFGLFYPGEAYVEVWGFDFGSGYFVASDMNTGLWVFKAT